MVDLLVVGVGVLLGSGVGLALVALRGGRSSGAAAACEYSPPPAGHRAVAATGGRALTCPCGWCLALPWPATSRRVNQARAGHYAAVEQERLARRLGVDVDSVLDQVVTARGVPGRALEAAGPALQPVGAPVGASSPPPPRPQPVRASMVVAQARRASAIARVEAGRVLPKYTGGEE